MGRGQGQQAMAGASPSALLWLDDLRPSPADYIWAKTVSEAQNILRRESIRGASLDHDLGQDTPEGYALCLWMAEHNIWPSEWLAVHSANPVGAERMCGVIERYGPYSRRLGRRFDFN